MKLWKTFIKLLKTFVIPLVKFFAFTFDIVGDILFFMLVHYIAKNIQDIYFVSGMTYFNLLTLFLAHIIIGLFIASNFEKIFKRKIHPLLQFVLFIISPITPLFVFIKMHTLDYEADHILDCEQTFGRRPTDVYRDYTRKRMEFLELRKYSGVLTQLLANLEDVPQITLMISFFIVDSFSSSKLGIKFNILPSGDFVDNLSFWAFFTLSLLTSFYSAMSSFIATTNVEKEEDISWSARVDLMLSIFLQICSRIGPVVIVCWFAILSEGQASEYETGPEWDISIWMKVIMIFGPLVFRWIGIFVIYNWATLSSSETIQQFQSLSPFDQTIQILNNSFVMNPLRAT